MSKSNIWNFIGGYQRVAVLGALASLAACNAGGTKGQGQLSASWRGGDSGQLAAPATASWCATGGLLEIMAIAGDSGVAVLVYPTDGVRSGTFTVVDPLRQPVHAGGAALAARWPAAENIIGWRGVSGTVHLKVDGGSLAGDMEGMMLRPGPPSESLTFKGTFAALRADSGPAACPPDSGGRHLPRDSATLPPAAPDSVRH